jgi:hypothetical protein
LAVERSAGNQVLISSGGFRVQLITRTLILTSAATALTLALALPQQAFAQAPPPQDQAQAAPQQRSLEGDLVAVNPDAKSITVKTATGEENFMYTDTTEVSGSQKSAAGLATLKEGRVTVHYTEDAKTKIKTATRIIVQPKK